MYVYVYMHVNVWFNAQVRCIYMLTWVLECAEQYMVVNKFSN